MANYKDKALEEYGRLGGSIHIQASVPITSLDELSTYYTPGVGAVASAAAQDSSQAHFLTGKNNSVAIISDGSAVLGLGNIGPEGALPVMQGKSAIFKNFADIDCYPVVLDVHSADEIVQTVKAIAPTYGAINLEDIAAPICFEVEERLKAELQIPVMHDDQHGTAIVVLAGLLNAMQVLSRELNEMKIVIVGAGAAGVAIAKLLRLQAQKAQIYMVDSTGVISASRNDLNHVKKQLLSFTNQDNISGILEDILIDADVFIGVSKAGLLTPEMIQTMHPNPIIFAMANPEPEILPEDALQAGAAIVATGRSDFPNQVNNALAFPGIFRGALDNGVRTITDDHKLAAAQVIANLVETPTTDKIIPDIFDSRLVPQIAKVIV